MNGYSFKCNNKPKNKGRVYKPVRLQVATAMRPSCDTRDFMVRQAASPPLLSCTSKEVRASQST